MYYILNPHIALRSWWRTPFAYYIKGVRDAQRLTKEEFEFLSLCDGQNELEDGEFAKTLARKGLISSCDKGEGTLDPWQKYRYQQRSLYYSMPLLRLQIYMGRIYSQEYYCCSRIYIKK